MTDTKSTEIDSLRHRIIDLEEQVESLRGALRKLEQGSRQGLLQIVAAIEEFRGDEPRTAELRKEAKRGKMKVE